MKVTKRLSVLGIEVYAPTKTEVRQWSDRKKKVVIPLLPSMVLVRIEEQDSAQVFDIPGVVRYLFEHGKRATISNEEVLAMQCYLDSTFNTDKKGIAVGDVIKVPMLDQNAEVVNIQGKKCMARLQKLGAVVSFQLS